MQLTEDRPETRYVLRAVAEAGITINDRTYARSLIVSPDQLIEDWLHGADLQASDLEPALALNPELILLGTGARQRMPTPAVLAACLTRGVGIEAMDNAAAGRTFNVLAGENRRVVAAFMLPG
jgi:uncharacterized protein